VTRPALDLALLAPLTVDRQAHRREDVDLTAVDAILVREGHLWARGDRLVRLAPEHQPAAALRMFLGYDRGTAVGALVPDASFAGVDSVDSVDSVAGVEGVDRADDAAGQWTGLRDFLGEVTRRSVFDAHQTRERGDHGERQVEPERGSEVERELAVTAVALSTWHANHPRCSVCGELTVPRSGGWVRYCEHDQREHYPRTDPAVIVAITDRQDRLLLAHASYWSPRRYSHLAGYVEPGESLEQAVHREVAEEASLRVRDVAYVGSQPWPFPASMMVAFTAVADDPSFSLDQQEITDAMWVTREQLTTQLRAGTVIAPPLGSIARRMMEAWFKGALPSPSSPERT